MTTTATIGMGAQFWLDNNASTPVLTKLAEMTSIDPPNPQTAQIDATNFDSANRRRYTPRQVNNLLL